ncbi:hypothetical protein E2320_021773 [Naja naja]|nr:hypothetical protein E2320_021773 [Naja naja]
MQHGGRCHNLAIQKNVSFWALVEVDPNLKTCKATFLPKENSTVHPTGQQSSPSIKLLVDDPIVVNPGEAITLVCVTTGGEPLPTLTWVRSVGTLPEKIILKGGTLTIPAINSDDAGTYSCIANNNVGNPAKKSTNIIVRDFFNYPYPETMKNESFYLSLLPIDP